MDTTQPDWSTLPALFLNAIAKGLATRVDILSFRAVCNSFKDFPFPSFVSSISSQLPQETSAFVNTHVDWKETPEAHEFKADLSGLKKEEVKVEIEDDRVLQISGERNIEKEDKKKIEKMEAKTE
ncbi:18.1 kDa class I heat shock protein-like [Pistacia vera]|uniref:18.1 kDa class I heat shock protein-like n=1 Tax=Pistacia vera TaxID=55513 RepID=UPI00126376A0|nr:18.1 kDa class I heat shock protein-like [Pistacia vera]